MDWTVNSRDSTVASEVPMKAQSFLVVMLAISHEGLYSLQRPVITIEHSKWL